MALGDSDITPILADLKARGEAVDVVLGGTTTQGVLRQSQELLTGDGGQVERVSFVTVKAGSLPGLAIGSALTVGGVSHTARDVVPGDDAGLTDIIIAP